MDPNAVTRTLSFALALAILGGAPARADRLPDPVPDAPADPAPDAPADPAPDAQAQLDALTARLDKLEDELAMSKDDHAALEERLAALLPLAGRVSGYADLGLFATSGNGAGTRSDLIGLYFPQYVGRVPGSWVFMGDPLSTMINSRGEPADTGESRAIVFDPIRSGGKPTFLVNAVNFAVLAGVGAHGSLNVSIDFVPRARDVSSLAGQALGDFVDVKLAYGEWKPRFDKIDLALQAGKLDSVLGFEYRSLEATDRTTVTPSLLCRYTCGRPIGLKARAQLLDKALVANVAVTNGSHFSESFAFASETDTNVGKTVAGRLSYLVAGKVELGVSGAFGAQDFQPDDGVFQWHVGADLHVDWKDLELTAELVRGKAKGATSMTAPAPCDTAPCLDYKGAYGLVAYRLTNTFVPYARVDWRDALHEHGASFVYISKVIRATVGVRAEFGARVIWKLEGSLNGELGGIPQFPNDVATTSLVIRY